jgi:hypothetical protein
MRNLISSVKSLDLSIEDDGIVLQQYDPGEDKYKFTCNRVIITALQVPQVVTALRKAAAKITANAAFVRTPYKYKKVSNPVAGGKESSEVDHDRK